MYLTSSEHLRVDKNYTREQKKYIKSAGRKIFPRINKSGTVILNLDSNSGKVKTELIMGDAKKLK